MALRSRLGVPLLVVAALCVAPVGRARAEPSDLHRARALFEEAGELELSGQWSAAQDRLRSALAIRETPHLRYALGWALENSGRLLEARAEYEVALRLARRDGIAEVSRIAATRVAEVERRIPLVQIRVRGVLAKDTRVLLDGRDVSLDPNGGAIQVDPGSRVVRIERSSAAPRELAFSISEGALRVIDVRGDEALGGAADRSTTSRSEGRRNTLPWILVGTGGALAIGGGLLFLSAASDASSRDESSRKWCEATACSNGTATVAETPEAAAFRRDAYDAASHGNTKQLAGALVGGLGIASIATGAVLLLTTKRSEARSTAQRKVEVDAAPLQGGAVAGATFTF